MSKELVESVACAWASIDGKAEAFDREREGMDYGDPDYTGHYEGYMAEAEELLYRSGVADLIERQAKLIQDMFVVLINRCDEKDPKVKDILIRAIELQPDTPEEGG